jgi:2-polyprenyl-6-methoxyphenol hydroxylase-like FAD-dependent oxidoreductase
MSTAESDLVIVGGGPAGMVAGLLFARAGVRTTVLEKHRDFLRDFRGDTVHPATLRIFEELGLLQRLLQRPHDKVPGVGAIVGGRHYEIADFSRFDRRWNFIAMMPQWHFLDFVAEEAARSPNFTLRMGAEAVRLRLTGDRVSGVVVREEGGERTLDARLTIAADGRRSILRGEAQLPLKTLGAPMDVLWFRLPKVPAATNETTGIFAAGRIMALIDRGDYWQCAYVFAKGEFDVVRARGLAAFQSEITQVAPMLSNAAEALESWDDVKLLGVALDRLERWHRPGLLAIGDAAHAMSPIAGVGINVAIQDAVAAANLLAEPLARGEDADPLLGSVQRRRLPAVRVIQGMQRAVQDNIISRLLAAEGAAVEAPFPVRLLDRWPLLRRLPAALIGFGIRSEHVAPALRRSPLPSRD